MRRPRNKTPGRKTPADEPPRPGGRALERLDQFNRQRGLPTESLPTPEPPDAPEKPPRTRE